MVRKTMIGFILTALTMGCGKSSEPVSNAATEYTDSLQDNLGRAQDAAEKANEAIAASQERMQRGDE